MRLPSTRHVLVAGLVTAIVITVAVAPADAAVVPPSTSATLTNANPADNTPHAQSGEVRAFAHGIGSAFGVRYRR